jgi:hypothetical protein
MQIGQHVVLIDDTGYHTSPLFEKIKSRGVIFPVKGIVYTVMETLMWWDDSIKMETNSIRLVEIKNKPIDYKIIGMSVQAFRASRFKPLQKLDVTQFQKEFVTLDA